MIKKFNDKPRAATHFPSLRHREQNINERMFVDDLHTGIIPIGGKTKNHPLFAIKFEGDEKDIERAIKVIVSLARYDGYGETEIVTDAIQNVALNLAWWGRAVYEIYQDEHEPKQYYLNGFTPLRLFNLPGCYIQWIPREDYQYYKKRFVVLPPSDIWEIEIPCIFGGMKGYKKLISKLNRFDHLSPKFWSQDLLAQQPTSDFNFKDYVYETEVYYEQLTRRWGWNRRDYNSKNRTEFYTFYRIITFRWAQAVIRDHIISKLNDLFMRLKLNSKLIVVGLPTSEEIIKVRNDMLLGKISFSDASKLTSL